MLPLNVYVSIWKNLKAFAVLFIPIAIIVPASDCKPSSARYGLNNSPALDLFTGEDNIFSSGLRLLRRSSPQADVQDNVRDPLSGLLQGVQLFRSFRDEGQAPIVNFLTALTNQDTVKQVERNIGLPEDSLTGIPKFFGRLTPSTGSSTPRRAKTKGSGKFIFRPHANQKATDTESTDSPLIEDNSSTTERFGQLGSGSVRPTGSALTETTTIESSNSSNDEDDHLTTYKLRGRVINRVWLHGTTEIIPVRDSGEEQSVSIIDDYLEY